MKNSTAGSSRKEMIAAMMTVIKNTRPKYNRVITTPSARIPTPREAGLRALETAGVSNA
jgi:hypothetical protein